MIFDAKQEIVKFLFSCWCLFFLLLGSVWRKFNGEDVLIGNHFYSSANLRLFVVTNYVISWSSDITFPPKSAFHGEIGEDCSRKLATSSDSTEEFVQKKEGAYKYLYNSTIVLSQTMKTMLHTIWNLRREFVWQSGASRIGHHLLYSHDFKYLMQGWNC